MIPARKPYPRYRASGVEWLGDVPEHWEVKRLKYSATINNEALPETTDPALEMSYVDISSVDAIRGIVAFEEMVFEDAPSRARRIVRDGDTIVSTVRTYLRAIAPIRNPRPSMIVSTGFAVVRPRTVSSTFLSYALRESGFVEAIVARSVGVSYPAVNASDIGTLPVPLPKIEEQRAIADCLDCETAKLGTLVEKKRALIEKLKEKRATLISRTVTRGLPPEAARVAGLSPHPKLKSSGVEWLGDVPAHWEVLKFSREIHIAEGQVDPEEEPYVSMVLIAPNHIESGTGQLLFTETAAEQGAESGKYLCRKGEVVYSKIRPALAKVTIAREDCLCSADMYPLKPGDCYISSYVFWLFLSQQFTAWSVLEADRVAMPKINRDTLNELRMPAPTVAEQHAIAAYLDRETTKIDRMVEKVEAAIERLREYRTALITAAVTGKIDVRGVRADNKIVTSGPTLSSHG
jgi:type I restriction enzyme S subunit